MSTPTIFDPTIYQLNDFITTDNGTNNFYTKLRDTSAEALNSNIFSYIKAKENNFQSTSIDDVNQFRTDVTSNKIKDDNVMKTYILNDYYLNNLESNLSTNITNLLNTETNYYNYSDLNENFKNKITTFDINDNILFNPNNNLGDIYDLDISYYSSQTAIKYMFLLDTLYFIYKNNQDLIGNNTIRVRYYIDSTSKWRILPNASINTTIIKLNFNVKNLLNKYNNITSLSNIVEAVYPSTSPLTKEKANEMFNSINESLWKNLYFMVNCDYTIYAQSFGFFFKTAKLMFINNILGFLNHSLYKTITNPSNNTYRTDFSIILNNNITNDDNLDNLLKINNGSISDNKYYFIKYTNPVSKYNLLSYTNSSADINNNINYKSPSESNINILYLSKNNYYLSKPYNYNIQYISQGINITIDSANKNISKITGLKDNTKYYIRLNNFGYIYNTATALTTLITNRASLLSIETSSTTNELLEIPSSNYLWDDYNKVLIIYPQSFTQNQDSTGKKIPNSKLGELNLTSTNTPTSSKIFYLNINNDNKAKSPLFTNNGVDKTFMLFVAGSNRNPLTCEQGNNISLISSQQNSLTEKIVSFSSATAITTASLYSISSSVSDNIIGNTTTTTNFTTYYTYNPLLPANNIIYDVKAVAIEENITEYNKIEFADPVKFTLPSTGIITPFDNLVTNTNISATFTQNNKFLENAITNLQRLLTVQETDISNISDSIVKDMYKLNTLNNSISTNSTSITKNYNNYVKQNNKLITSNYIEIYCIILFVLTFISAVYIIIINNKKISLPIALLLFIIVFITYFVLFSINFFNKNKEEFTLPSDYPTTNNNSYYTSFNDILGSIVKNLQNLKIGIAQEIIKPKIQKEVKNFTEKSKLYVNYNNISYNDADIIRISRLKKEAQYTLLLNISLIISICSILNILYPEYNIFILIIGIILILLAIYFYYYKSLGYVRTKSKNFYWQKPNNDTLNTLI